LLENHAGFGAGAAWKGRHVWRTKALSLGKSLTGIDAALFAINIATKDLLQKMSRTNHQHTEIVMKSRLALTEIESTHHWVLPVVTDVRRQAKQAEEEGSRAILT
jgi:hypothetical protein